MYIHLNTKNVRLLCCLLAFFLGAFSKRQIRKADFQKVLEQLGFVQLFEI